MPKDLQKTPAYRNPKLISWARGHYEGCQIRLDGCQWGPTVASHVPSGVRFGKGIGSKPPDWAIALACQNCHDIVDRRLNSARRYGQITARAAWHDGHLATIDILFREGKIQITI